MTPAATLPPPPLTLTGANPGTTTVSVREPPPPLMLSPAPWNLTPAYFQGNQYVKSMPPPPERLRLPDFCARPNAFSIVPERSYIEFVGSEELRRWWWGWCNNLFRR